MWSARASDGVERRGVAGPCVLQLPPKVSTAARASDNASGGFENGDAIGFQYAGSGWCQGSACGNGNPAYYACDCQTFNGCSGDWNTPNCP